MNTGVHLKYNRTVSKINPNITNITLGDFSICKFHDDVIL